MIHSLGPRTAPARALLSLPRPVSPLPSRGYLLEPVVYVLHPPRQAEPRRNDIVGDDPYSSASRPPTAVLESMSTSAHPDFRLATHSCPLMRKQASRFESSEGLKYSGEPYGMLNWNDVSEPPTGTVTVQLPTTQHV